MAKASLILSFYNKIDVLKLVLTSLELQSEKDFEIIIADDGSRNEIVEELQILIDRSPNFIKHCWHADNGWQKNKILNQAVRESSGSYLIFVDGDCLLHQKFVAEHLRYSEKGVVLTGRRVNLSKRVTQKLSENTIEEGYLGKPLLFDSILDNFRGNGKDFEQGFYFGSSKFGTWLNRKDKGILGSNFSLGREDFYAVNGFDERFTHPAVGEDTDIGRRLKRNGCRIQTVRNRAIQYHIYHKELPREEARLKFLLENDEAEVTFTPYGIDKGA